MLSKKKLTQAQFISYAGILSAVAIVLVLIEIPYPLVPWLKMDLSEVIILIAALMNIWLAIVIALLKASLTMLIKPNAEIIGHIAMFIASLAIVLPFYFSNTKLSKAKSLVIATFAFAIIMTALNYFWITPAYLQTSFSAMASTTQQLTLGTTKMLENGNPIIDVEIGYFGYIVAMYMPFNLMKGTIVSLAFYYVSNRISKEK